MPRAFKRGTVQEKGSRLDQISNSGVVCVEPCRNDVSEDRRTVERLRNAASEIRQTITNTQVTIDEARRLIRLTNKMANPSIASENSN